MKKNIIALLLMLPCHLALAHHVTIEVNGKVVKESCNVSSSDLIKNVNFPDLDPKDFKTVGSKSISEPIWIHLEKCTGNIKGLYYQFSGTPDDTDPTLLKVTGKADTPEGGVATGLAVELMNQHGQKMILNKMYSFPEKITTPTYIRGFYLRYRSVSSNVGPGDASSVAYLDIYYE